MPHSVFLKAALMCLLLLLTPMLAHAEALWVDVRSEAEYRADHIDGDPLIPYRQIVEEMTERFPDRDQEIRLYCASGVRAGRAKSALENVGYKNVSNVGGIADAREARGLSGQ